MLVQRQPLLVDLSYRSAPYGDDIKTTYMRLHTIYRVILFNGRPRDTSLINLHRYIRTVSCRCCQGNQMLASLLCAYTFFIPHTCNINANVINVTDNSPVVSEGRKLVRGYLRETFLISVNAAQMI